MYPACIHLHARSMLLLPARPSSSVLLILSSCLYLTFQSLNQSEMELSIR